MTVVSSKEFISNQKQYFDLALNEDIVIKRGKKKFHLIYAPTEKQYPEQPILEPDNDFRRAITKDVLLEGIYEDIAKRFIRK